MPRTPFRSRVEVDTYLAEDPIRCLECGRRFRSLGRHLRGAHGVSTEEYRSGWGLPAGTPLAAPSYRAVRTEIAQRLSAEGRIGGHAAAASEAARSVPRGRRVAWDLAEQVERARAMGRRPR